MLFCVNIAEAASHHTLLMYVWALMVWLSTQPDQINWHNIIYRRSKKQVIISFVSHSALSVDVISFLWNTFSMRLSDGNKRPPQRQRTTALRCAVCLCVCVLCINLFIHDWFDGKELIVGRSVGGCIYLMDLLSSARYSLPDLVPTTTTRNVLMLGIDGWLICVAEEEPIHHRMAEIGAPDEPTMPDKQE